MNTKPKEISSAPPQRDTPRYWSPTTGKVHASRDCAALQRGKIPFQDVGAQFPHLPKCKKCYSKP